MDSDKTMIEILGGPSKVAQLLGFNKKGGVQRVNNWRTRGIPARVKLQFADVFLTNIKIPDKRDHHEKTRELTYGTP